FLMRKASLKLPFLLLIFAVLFAFLHSPICVSSKSYVSSYQLLDKPDGSKYYRLNVTVQQSLYEYYAEKSHTLYSENDFAKFVTPHALKPIADSLWKVYSDDEDFVNGALMIVHQIPYKEITPAKYPVETIIENIGDCDLFSYIAASIIKAGGLDVLLLYYESEAHMNIAVRLSHVPHDVRGQACFVMYNDAYYYMAECTNVGEWQASWRVGECPTDLKYASAQKITLENCEQWAPGQVSASYEALKSSAISLDVSSAYLIQESTLTISGQLSPSLQNENVTIYAKINNLPWMVLVTVVTDSDGRFTYVWTVNSSGICSIRASWYGNDNYAGADSPTRTITILSLFFVLLLAAVIALVCVGIGVLLWSRQSQREIQEPQQ
ncbi:MAG: Ig-like domain repeat protein, partial [Candidatus Thorarchaeota archaeon]|nr:Ig-like domain repeat protein [Candidatus Thorarchaeota archaeon]